MRAFTRYRRFMFIVLLGTLLGGIFLNTWVNPWRVTNMPWSSPAFENYRAIDQASNRTSKAGLARSQRWDAAIFGSSRVDIGFNPQDPAFGGLKVANLGLNAGNIDENEAIFRYFMETQSPRLVIFLIDAGDLTKPTPLANGTDFATSPLVKDSRPLERALRYHTGISALSASLQTLSRRVRGQPSDHTPQGFRREAKRLENPRAQIASLYLSTTWRLAQDRTNLDSLNAGKVEMVRNIIRTCREKNTRLVFVMPPNHVAFQLTFPELKDSDPYFHRDRQVLTGLVAAANETAPAATPVELWDFQDAHPLNGQPLPLTEGGQMEGWIDLFHFTPEIGSLMVKRIQGGAGDYGVRLTPDTLAPRMASVEGGLTKWSEDHPEDMKFLRDSLKNFGPLLQKSDKR